MMCVPPMPNPGKCPICGMKMVEVEEDGGDEDAGPRTLTLSPRAQKLAEIEVASVVRKFVEAEIRMVGKIDYDETRVKYITAWVPGRLDRLYVDYTGVPVKKGDHLVYIYSPELLVAQVELLRSIETAEVLRASVTQGVRESAEALVEDAREKLRLWGLTKEQIRGIEERGKTTDHMTIYAPIGGIVVHKNATEGMYVDTGTRIYTIADLSHLWVKLDAYESDLAWMRYGQTVEFETEAYPGETFTGTVAFIDPVLDGKTRTVKVRVNVDNSDGRLKPQMFVRAVVRAKLAEGGSIVNTELAGKWISPMHPEIVKDEPGDCDVCGMPLVRAETLGFVSPDDLNARPPLVVPATAVLMTGKRAVVYVALPDKPGTYEGRVIVPGARAGDYYLVREGLVEGEQVVVHGNFKIDSAMQILAKPSMMSPEGGGPAPGHQHHGAEGSMGVAPAKGRAAAHTDRQAGPFDVPREFTAQLEPLFDTYFHVHRALSLDSDEDAKGAAQDFCKALEAVDMSLLQGAAHQAWMKELEDITKTARGIVAAVDIQKARSSFAMLSESMIGVAKRFGAGSEDVYRFHCPIAFNDRGADWLQNDQETANPYFGSVMFRCGVLKETFAHESAGDSTGGEGGH
ncbi:MAG: efflux RND transporter periplasmic adaptor subunit [Planctomycetes bacterium]|nr:efflux RND transporter periplasmic adaptor subunit [Planctomycetota bacterium]